MDPVITPLVSLIILVALTTINSSRTNKKTAELEALKSSYKRKNVDYNEKIKEVKDTLDNIDIYINKKHLKV